MYKSIFKHLDINTEGRDYKALNIKPVKDDEYIILGDNVYQCDLITMPYFEGYNYILNVVNMRDKFTDCRPLKNKSSDEVINALIEIIHGELCGNIKYLFCDQGAEFTNAKFKRFCKNNNIILTFVRVGNHKQAGIVEANNRHYKKILNEYLSVKSKDGEYFLNWVSILKKVRDGINHYKLLHQKPIYNFMNSSYEGGDKFKFKIGEKVHIMLDYPKTLINNVRMHSGHGSGFRSGDKRFTDEVYKVVGYSMPPGKQLRYKVEDENGNKIFGNYLSRQLLKV